VANHENRFRQQKSDIKIIMKNSKNMKNYYFTMIKYGISVNLGAQYFPKITKKIK